MKNCILSLTFFVSALFLSSSSVFSADQKLPVPAPAVEKKAEAVSSKVATEELVDINSATAEQLKKIAGIGDEYSKKIIAGRPYAKKDQLKSRKIVPDALYEKIKDKIVAKQIKVDDKKK